MSPSCFTHYSAYIFDINVNGYLSYYYAYYINGVYSRFISHKKLSPSFYLMLSNVVGGSKFFGDILRTWMQYDGYEALFQQGVLISFEIYRCRKYYLKVII